MSISTFANGKSFPEDSAKEAAGYFKRWLIMAPLGLVLIGAGLSVVGEAIIIKQASASVWSWFWWGTGGLALVNAGISVVGQAIIYRVKYEQRKGQ